jgi:hypothetical protein
MVALHDVHSAYQLGKDGRQILIIDGQAENVSSSPLHIIGVTATLQGGPGTGTVRRDVYCGNNLVSKTISAMTTHEIDFFQGLPPPDSFVVDPSRSCRFVIVFTQPPQTANHFALAIAHVDPRSTQPSATAS